MSFFKQNNLVGKKTLDFKDWCKVAEIMKSKEHLTPSGIKLILSIKAGMNTGRVKE
jgi:hypothetical protein